MTEPSATHATNRLAQEKSPYLLQHAANPVDWYPWGDEAFEKAKTEDKPIFLSIGYSTCHWCHVMERESFENPEIAALLNRWFVSIKIDREEHPDVDQVYMSAVTAMTGQGGWPLTVFLTPDRRPFYGATYLPPEQRWNMPGMRELLPAIARAWTEQRPALLESADRLVDELKSRHLSDASSQAPVTAALLDAAFKQATNAFDPRYGGFGHAPKFPRPHELSFLLHYHSRTGSEEALSMATATLDGIIRSGIHDHLGGGIHRYSTDAEWLVPHFEKMLYDQALSARAAVEAYQVTADERYAVFARDVLDYVLRDLTGPEGAFYAGEDADSEGEEGRFYVWTSPQVRDVSPEDADLFMRVYGVSEQGNFEHGGSILHLKEPLESAAKQEGLSLIELENRLEAVRERLLLARNKRIRPHRDDKILTSWNGLAIAAFARASLALEEPRYRDAARRAADFILTRLSQDGRLLRRYREGDARYPGSLEDYAFFGYGLLELYEATFDSRYLEHAKRVAQRMVELFWDQAQGGFWMRARDQEPLISPSKDVYDGATPSGNSVAALMLLRLGRMLGDSELEAYGQKTLEANVGTINQAPFGYPQLLIAADATLGPGREIVLAGDPASAPFVDMQRAIASRFLPRTVVLGHTSDAAGIMLERLVPSVAAQVALSGRASAYVCERFVCRLPAMNPGELIAHLENPTKAQP